MNALCFPLWFRNDHIMEMLIARSQLTGIGIDPGRPHPTYLELVMPLSELRHGFCHTSQQRLIVLKALLLIVRLAHNSWRISGRRGNFVHISNIRLRICHAWDAQSESLFACFPALVNRRSASEDVFHSVQVPIERNNTVPRYSCASNVIRNISPSLQ